MEKMNRHLIYTFFKGLSLMPLSILYVFSDVFLYPLVYFLIRYRLKVVRLNLRNSFPDRTVQELKSIERRFYRHFCDSFFETIRMLSMTEKEAAIRMQYVNPSLVTDYAKKNQGVLVVLGHYGTWEYQSLFHLRLSSNQRGFSVYKPLKSKAFDYLYHRIRTRFGGEVVTKNNTYRTIVRLKKDGLNGVFGLISDQSPSVNNLTYWTTFLNQDTAVLTGVDRMARQTGFAVLYADVLKVKRGCYQTVFKLISDNPQDEPANAITEQYTRLMEQTIIREPSYWLWTHKRWKHHQHSTVKTN